MAKKYFEEDHQEWLRSLESGKSIQQVAVDIDCDPRTVRDGIDKARRARDRANARFSLVRDALQKHHDELIETIGLVEQSVAIPQDDLIKAELILKNITSIPIEKGKYKLKKGYSKIVFDYEDNLGWELTKEHLPWRDKAVSKLISYKDILKTHLDNRVALLTKTIDLIGKALHGSQQSKGRFDSISPVNIDHFYLPIVRTAIGRIDRSDPHKCLKTSADNTQIISTASAYLIKNLSDAKGSIKSIQQAYPDILNSNEFSAVGKSFTALNNEHRNTRKQIQELKMLNLLPGECRVCRQIGI